MDDSVIFSIDKFNQSKLEKTDEIFGAVKARVYNKGHYDSTKEEFNRLKPNEYSNPLLLYKYKNVFDPTNESDMEHIKQLTNDKVRLSHFMVPFQDKAEIKRAGSLYGFIEDDADGNGHLEEYPSVKFVYAHSIELILPPEITRLGDMSKLNFLMVLNSMMLTLLKMIK